MSYKGFNLTFFATTAIFSLILWATTLQPASGSESPNSTRSKTTLMMCDFIKKTITVTVGKYKPKRCTGLRADQSFVDGFNYGTLRWSSWSRKRAYFKGISLGFKLPYSRIKVRGKVDRPRRDRCGSSRMVFTRMKYRTRFGKSVRYLRPCLGRSG